jgi:hypothetical protein
MYGNYICWSNLSHWTGNTTDTARLASYHQSHLEIDTDDRLRTKLYDKNNFPILDFPFKYVATFQQHLYMEYIFDYTNRTYPWSCETQILRSGQPSHGGDCKTFEVMISTSPLPTRCSIVSLLALTATEYLCLTWPWICSVCVITILSFPHSWHITGFVTRVTRRVSHVEQELLSKYKYCWNVTTCTYNWKVHNEEIEIISFVVKFRS